MSDNIFTFLYELFYSLLKYSTYAWDFLFTTHNIGLQFIDNPFGDGYLIDISFPLNIFGVIASGGFVVFLLLWLVKTFIPVA